MGSNSFGSHSKIPSDSGKGGEQVHGRPVNSLLGGSSAVVALRAKSAVEHRWILSRCEDAMAAQRGSNSYAFRIQHTVADFGGSILMTSTPMSANIVPHTGPETIRANSTTIKSSRALPAKRAPPEQGNRATITQNWSPREIQHTDGFAFYRATDKYAQLAEYRTDRRPYSTAAPKSVNFLLLGCHDLVRHRFYDFFGGGSLLSSSGKMSGKIWYRSFEKLIVSVRHLAINVRYFRLSSSDMLPRATLLLI